MMKQITLKEAVERGYDIHSLLGVDKNTKQLIRKTNVQATQEIKAINNTPVVEVSKETYNHDFDLFIAWCEKEYNKTPSMQDYKDAMEYYSVM